jgi:cytochrome b subunit of formate dehydrogenase
MILSHKLTSQYFLLLSFIAALPLRAVDDKDCYTCHSDSSLTTERNGTLISLFVPDVFENTPHAGNGCVSCHVDADVQEFPHPAPLQQVNCGQCHEDMADANTHGLHRRAINQQNPDAPDCQACHGKHAILPAKNLHSDIHRNNIVTTCMRCHVTAAGTHQSMLHTELWQKTPSPVPVCSDCHSAHRTGRQPTTAYSDHFCLQCHSNPKLTRARPDGTTDSLYVRVSALQHSIHKGDVACVSCHTHISSARDPVCKNSAPATCFLCHQSESRIFDTSIHGTLQHQGDVNAPSCGDCHNGHLVLSPRDSRSTVARKNIPRLCADCHRAGEVAATRYRGMQKDIVLHYQTSIHGQNVEKHTAICTDCHDSHNILPSEDPHSTVNNKNIGLMCGKCHAEAYQQFSRSIHSYTFNPTSQQLPGCDKCHRSHEIMAVNKDDFRMRITSQCGDCHADLTGRYFNTFHGKVSKLGSVRAAKCNACHGSHNILPPANPASTLSKQNILHTCRQCHPKAGQKFTGYLTHATYRDRSKFPILFYTYWIMVFLIIVVFTFFGLYTLLSIPRVVFEYIKNKKRKKERPQKYIVRFQKLPRFLHLLVIISFFGLATTGMMIKFSTFGWTHTLSHILGGFHIAGIIHRICAAITFFYFGLHFVYIIQNARKEKMSVLKYMFSTEGMLPGRRDIRQFIQTIRWFLGRKLGPRYNRWTYWEKFDYFAVFWGVAIIGSSGLILWFPEFFTRFLPGYIINVATIVHSEEALLAVGFIFTIHFFNTHFRPIKFPLDTVIFTGKVPFGEWKRERIQEYQRLTKSGKLKDAIVSEPPSKILLTGVKIFGVICLAIGFTLIFLIVKSLLSR